MNPESINNREMFGDITKQIQPQITGSTGNERFLTMHDSTENIAGRGNSLYCDDTDIDSYDDYDSDEFMNDELIDNDLDDLEDDGKFTDECCVAGVAAPAMMNPTVPTIRPQFSTNLISIKKYFDDDYDPVNEYKKNDIVLTSETDMSIGVPSLMDGVNNIASGQQLGFINNPDLRTDFDTSESEDNTKEEDLKDSLEPDDAYYINNNLLDDIGSNIDGGVAMEEFDHFNSPNNYGTGGRIGNGMDVDNIV